MKKTLLFALIIASIGLAVFVVVFFVIPILTTPNPPPLPPLPPSAAP